MASQRNTVLEPPPRIRFDNGPGTLPISPEEDDPGEFSEPNDVAPGLPGGDQDHEFDDTSPIMSVSDGEQLCSDGGCATPSITSPVTSPDYEKPWDLGGLDDENLQETAILDSESDGDIPETVIMGSDDGDIRETAILDSDTDEENTTNTWNHNHRGYNQAVNNGGYFDKVDESLNRNILESDEENYPTPKRNNPNHNKMPNHMDTLPVYNSGESRDQSPSAYSDSSAVEIDIEGNTDTMTRTKSRKRDKKSRESSKSKSPRRSKSREDKKDKKREGTLKRDKEKEKDKKKDGTLKKDKDKEKDKKRQGTFKKDKEKESDKKDHSKELERSKSKKEKKKDKKERIESDPPSKSDLKRSNTKKDMKKDKDQKLQKKGSVLKRKNTKKGTNSVRLGSSSSTGEEMDGLRRRPSDESFVTAHSESFADDGIDNEVFEEEGAAAVTKQPLPSGAGNVSFNDIAIDMDSPYDIEMSEYPEMKDNQMNFGTTGDLDPLYDEEGSGKVTVPISICLIIIAGYIFGGAVLFTLWEEWDYLTGSYFCFITLSTIGFGDIVPGTDMKEWASHEKLVLCALWLAFGLSLLAMCFNLMQEEVKEKCKWLGQKLGLLRDDDEG